MSSDDAVGPSDPRLNQPADSHCKPDFVLGLLSPNDINILAGPPDSGKYRLLLVELNNYFATGTFFGKRDGKPERSRIGMICRQRKYLELKRIINSLKLEHLTKKNFPIIRLDREHGTTETIQSAYARFDNHPEVLIVQSLQSMLPSSKSSDLGEVSSWYDELGAFCAREKVTILATAYTCKQKPGETYTRPAERILGSAAWGECGTVMTLDFPEEERDAIATAQRVLTISIPDELLIVRNLEFCSEGRLLQLQSPEGWRARMLARLHDWPATDPLKTGEIVAWGAQEEVPRVTAYRWISELHESGEIVKVSHGTWKRARSN